MLVRLSEISALPPNNLTRFIVVACMPLNTLILQGKIFVDHLGYLIQCVYIHSDQNRSKDLLFITSHFRLKIGKQKTVNTSKIF